MKNKILILTLFCGYMVSLSAQDYTQYARILDRFKSTNASVIDYKNFLDTVDYPFPEPYTYLLSTIQSQQIDSALEAECIKRLILSGYYGEYYVRYTEVAEKIYERYKPIYENKINKLLQEEVKRMYEADQKVRNSEDEDWNEILRIDSLNHLEFKKMIQKYGKLPGIKEVGYGRMEDLLLMLRHLDGDTALFNYLYPILLQQVKAGDFPPKKIASLVDYYWHSNFIPLDSTKLLSYQLYGTASLKLNDSLNIKIPVKDWEVTERLRYQIGLEPLKKELDNDRYTIYNLELFKEKFPMFQD